MKNLIHSTIILTLIFFAGYINGMAQSSDTYHPPCMSCDSLKYLRLPDVKINEVINIPAGEKSAAHCRVLGTIGTEINFELLLPERWNRRYIMGGGGGFVGSVQNMASYTVHEGYATSGTDTGHKGNGIKADWALNNIERQVNFGFLAVHRTAEVSKVIALNYYGREALYSYFLGCSRGGGQALMEAQRFPDDFDGIVCGAPAFTWPAIGAEFIQNMQKIYPDPGNQTVPVITKNNLAMLENAILEKCDGIDGIKDGIMNDPRDCGFQLSSLPICKENKIRDDCFTPAQVDAIRTIYEGPSDGNRKIYPGFPFGGENDPIGWPAWIVGPNEGTMNLNFPSLQYGFGTEMFKYLVFNDPEWDFHSYDFSSFFEETKFTSSFLDADGADYSRFNANGNKLILYHGWSDAALSALKTIEYYESVENADQALRNYFRLFLLPGVQHCGGGPGPDRVDWIKLIRDWVENGVAPERVVMSKMKDGTAIMTRPVFPYPRKAIFDGKGDPNMETSFK